MSIEVDTSLNISEVGAIALNRPRAVGGNGPYQPNRAATCGQNTINPMTTAAIAVTNTAPAATSFASFTIGWKFGDAASARNSNAVFNASAVQTIAMATTIQHHSKRVSWNKTPRTTTSIVAAA